MSSEEDTMIALSRLVVVVALLDDLSFVSGVVDVYDLLSCIVGKHSGGVGVLSSLEIIRLLYFVPTVGVLHNQFNNKNIKPFRLQPT